MTDHILQHYDRLLTAHRDGHARVGWGSRESQQRRFQILAEIAAPLAGTVLDVGCGLGDLFPFLKDRAPGCTYTGIDIHPDMIAEARRRFPDARFEVLDILSLAEPLPRHDYVVMSGAANLATDQYPEFREALIRRMFAMAKEGIAFNLLSNRADFIEPGEVYGDPGGMVDFCLGLTRRVVLRHDYMPHDFTVYLYRDA